MIKLTIFTAILLFALTAPSTAAEVSGCNNSKIEFDNISGGTVKKTQSQIISSTSEKSFQNENKPIPVSELNPNLFSRAFSNEIVYNEYYLKANAINPCRDNSSMSYYPGSRGPNQLIVYTPSYGYRTGTNEFGTEAIIVNNMVVALNGADSIIPRNGFVVSGHGSAKTRIQKTLKIGSKVYVDFVSGGISIYYTPESLLFAAKEKYKEVDELISYYKKNDTGYNSLKASEEMALSDNAIKNAEKRPEKAHEYIDGAMKSLEKAMKNAIPYKKDELKGIWLRPVEHSPEEIEKTVARIHESGITDIFLETYYHGKTIYPSKYVRSYGVTEQREEFRGFDPLDVWIKCAHKNNMKVHIWFETYYVGNEKPMQTPYHVLNIYPSWSNKRLTSYESSLPVPSPSEHNGYFLDPANPAVQSYLFGIIKEIIDEYHPDGINLDYIRYPQSVDTSYSNYASSNWGYTQYARNEFSSIYGIDPIDVKYGSQEWDMWSSYRQNKITEFVAGVNKLTSENKILLTAVIFPDLKKSRDTKMQNWQIWSMKNYVDGVTPLLLTGDVNTAVNLLSDVIKNTTGLTKIYPGLFVTFMGGTYDELLMQIHKTREFKSKGTVMFDYAHLDQKYIDALNTRIYNKAYDLREIKQQRDTRKIKKR